MANAVFPVRFHPDNKPHLWRVLANQEMHWVNAPRFGWECAIKHTDLFGSYSTQTTIITIPALDFVTGRITVVFAAGGVTLTTVTADAAVGDTEADLGLALAAAIVTEIDPGGDLEDYADDAQDNEDGTVTVFFLQGVGAVTVTATYEPAQQTTVTWGGTLVDGEYSVRLVCADPAADVTVDNDRVAGSPANANAMAAAFETAAEGLIATTLAGVLVSADDSGAVNTLIFEPGVTCTVTASVTSNTTHTFGGTATDGDYVTRFAHSSLPGGSLDITTTRAGGNPATNTDLADAFEADVEARALLAPLLENADNTAGANVLTFFPGVTGMDVTAVSDPDPGTLTVSDPTVVVADETPAGPEVTVNTTVALDLNSISWEGGIPSNILREYCFIDVVTAFGAGRTITVGDSTDPDGIAGSTPIDLNATGNSASVAADAEYEPRAENAYTPLATIDLGSSLSVSAGEVRVEICFYPNMQSVALGGV